jgi:hypothetical protein
LITASIAGEIIKTSAAYQSAMRIANKFFRKSSISYKFAQAAQQLTRRASPQSVV